MESGNVILDSLFDGLSSIYRKDDGMVNSNLFTVLNAYAEVFSDVQRKLDQTGKNRYIATADPDALEDNFGILIDFPKPPRLNTLTNGNEIYRAMVRSLYKVFQSGSTNAAMNQALDTAVSFLTIDPRTEDAVTVINYTNLLTVDDSVTLTWNAVQTSGTSVVGPARPQDIIFFPSDIIPVSYDDSNKIVSFTGTVNTGTQYQVIYSRDNTAFRGTNWINISDSAATATSPFALKSGTISTYNDPQFSYWWNTFNADGEGVVIDEFKIDRRESALAWRLPEKTVQFISPYSGEVLTRTIEFYNLSGTAYNIENLDSVNLDTYFSDKPLNYYTDVSPDFTDYYIRYSTNNAGPNVALSQFNGSLPKFLKKYQSIEFSSDNFGTLDFFEKSDGFDADNLFGTGTSNVWLNVPNVNGKYILNNDLLFERPYSLHERVFYQENFESGQLNKISSTDMTGTTITDLVGVPFIDKEDCMMLMSPSSGVAVSASPKITGSAISATNRIQLDFFDSLNSGTRTLIDIIRTGINTDEYNRLRVGIDTSVLDFEYSELDPLSASKNFGFVETFFESEESTNRAVDVFDSITGNPRSYTLVTGTNPNVLRSDTSLQPTGNSVRIVPNSSTSIVTNADTLKVQFTDNGVTGNGVSVQMKSIEYLGIEPISGQPFYAAQTFTMTPPFPSAPGVWCWVSNTTFMNTGTGFIGGIGTGGPTTIPYSTGLNSLEIIKNVGTSVNGVLYTGDTAHNIAHQWGDIGIGQGLGLDSVQYGNPSGITTTAQTGTTIFHYELSNAAQKQSFIDNLNAFSGISSSQVPYFYQVFTEPQATEAPKNYINAIPRNFGWNRLTVDFGTGYSGTQASLGEYQFYNNPNIGFSGTLLSVSGVAMINQSNYPTTEFSYFDNIQASYYNKSITLPEYQLAVSLSEDWAGSALSENTVIDNKFFELDPQPNFQFNVLIRGLDESFIFIINKIIEKLKPAHTIATSIFEQAQSLDTTSLVPIISSTGTDWETGNIMNNIIILPTGSSSVGSDLPGLITISGNTP